MNEVDLVLAVTELLGVLGEDGGDSSNRQVAESFLAHGQRATTVNSQQTVGNALDLNWASHLSGECSTIAGGRDRLGSGGYVDYIFRRAALELFGKDVGQRLVYVQGRNADFQEVMCYYGLSLPFIMPSDHDAPGIV